MKRSEMLRIISDVFYEERINHDSYKRLAESLLMACEDAGMLPPLKEGIELGVTGTMGNDGRMYFKFEWEPE